MKLPITIALLCSMAAASAQQQPPQQREHRGPPQEAFDACKGKHDGDTVQMKTPRGDAVSATCRMVAVPSRPAEEGNAPPPRR